MVSTYVKWALGRISIEAEQSVAGGTVRVRRRRWSEARKRRIVAESYEPRVSVSVVARRYDVNANQVPLARVEPMVVAAYVEEVTGKLSAASVKQHLATLTEARSRRASANVLTSGLADDRGQVSGRPAGIFRTAQRRWTNRPLPGVWTLGERSNNRAAVAGRMEGAHRCWCETTSEAWLVHAVSSGRK